jgi:hypothetical protein
MPRKTWILRTLIKHSLGLDQSQIRDLAAAYTCAKGW